MEQIKSHAGSGTFAAATAEHLVLASSSPRRQQLLAEAGYRFTVVAPSIDEPDPSLIKLPPSQQAEALAYFKARAVWDSWNDRTVVGADTIVALGDRVLGKAPDDTAARAMLASLSGTRHIVITGVTVLKPDGRRLIASDSTWVTMRPWTAQELDAYVASGEWIGKAGAYALQETADRFVTSIEGSWSNVVGLPMELLSRMLLELKD
jgi:septum formation protein